MITFNPIKINAGQEKDRGTQTPETALDKQSHEYSGQIIIYEEV